MKRQWEQEELIDQWTLSVEDRTLLGNKTGATRLGFAVLLKYFGRLGRFPQQKNDIPAIVISYVATQIGVDPAAYLQYDWQGRTVKEHRAQIRAAYGFREATVEDGAAMAAWLAEHVLPREHQEDAVRAACYRHFRLQKIEPPTMQRVTRIVRSAYRTFETTLYQTISDRLDEHARAELLSLLTEQEAAPREEEELITLQHLRMDPGRVGVETMLTEIAKLRRLRTIGLPVDLFTHLSPKVVRVYRHRAGAETPSLLRAHPEPIRLTLLAALCWQRSQEITDSLVDLLIQIVHRIGARAERRVEEVYVQELKRVAGKESILYHIADAAVKQPDGKVAEVIYPVASESLLRDLIKEYESKGPVFRRQVHLVMRTSYSHHYRRMLPQLLDVLEFRSNNESYRPIIRAVTLVKDYVHSPRQYYPAEEIIPIKDIVKAKWRDLVVEKDEDGTERVNRINYEVCLLQALRDKARSKEIWVVGADRYRNPDEDLPTDFEESRAEYYEALKQPASAVAFTDKVQAAMKEALSRLDAAMPRLAPKVKMLPRKGGWIHVSPLDAQPEPPNLARLKLDVATRWPLTSLLDILKETDLQIGFTEQFTSVAQREVLDRSVLQKRLLLCLYGLGTNTGFKRLANADPGTTYADLRYVRARYIHKEQLRNAIAQVANAIFRVRKAEIWGEGTTACASDSKKFGAWDHNLMTEWHIRYGGRGVMIY
jgi:hypothetical protein